MKNKNTLLFIITSFLIISLFIFIGYRAASNFGNSDNASSKNLLIQNNTKDSLNTVFNKTVAAFDSALIERSGNPASKLNISANDLNEYIGLKNEIKNILKDSTGTPDLVLAKQKIDVLEYKIEELKNRNTYIEADNKRLNALVAELIRKDQLQTVTKSTNPLQSVSNTNKLSNGKLVNDVVFKTYQVQNEKKFETNSANQISTFEGSFTANTKELSDIYVVLQSPTGEVIKNSDWESGILKTNEGQRKVFSTMIRTDGNGKQVGFKINAPENTTKGTYTLQLYHQGYLIAKTSRTLAN